MSNNGETCDDGNLTDNFGCNTTCSGVIPGYNCDSVVNNKSICFPICGDGKRVSGEICDDQNNTDNLGC